LAEEALAAAALGYIIHSRRISLLRRKLSKASPELTIVTTKRGALRYCGTPAQIVGRLVNVDVLYSTFPHLGGCRFPTLQ